MIDMSCVKLGEKVRVRRWNVLESSCLLLRDAAVG